MFSVIPTLKLTEPTLVERGSRRVSMVMDVNHPLTFVGHAPRNYMSATVPGVWVPDGASETRVQNPKHPQQERGGWNLNFDTVKVEGGVVTRCTDTESSDDRAAWHAENKVIFQRNKFAKLVESECKHRWIFPRATLNGVTYIGVHAALLPNGQWIALRYEGIVN